MTNIRHNFFVAVLIGMSLENVCYWFNIENSFHMKKVHFRFSGISVVVLNVILIPIIEDHENFDY